LTTHYARDNVAGMVRSEVTVPYPEASRALLRNSVLDAMRDLLLERDWSKVTLSDVSSRAGVSRQTLYNEFGSRLGLGQAYAVRLADDFVDHVDAAVWSNVGDVRSALIQGLRGFFVDSASDPLIVSLRTGEVKPDLLRLITLDAAPIIDKARQRLSETFQHSWVSATEAEATTFSEALVRIAMSYIAMPPTSYRDVAAELSTVFSPFVDALIAKRSLA
jgi:AcrR family transcriptional regulator